MSEPRRPRSGSNTRARSAGHGLVPLMLPEMVQSRDRVARSLSSPSSSPPRSPPLPYESYPLPPSRKLSSASTSSELSFIAPPSRAPLVTSCPCGLCNTVKDAKRRLPIQASICEHQELLQANERMDHRINRALMWTEDLIAEGKKALENSMGMIERVASVPDDPAFGYSSQSQSSSTPQGDQPTIVSNDNHGPDDGNAESDEKDTAKTQSSHLRLRRRRITMASRIPLPTHPATAISSQQERLNEGLEDPEIQGYLERLSNITTRTRLMLSRAPE